MTWLLDKALKGRPYVKAAVKHSATLPYKTNDAAIDSMLPTCPRWNDMAAAILGDDMAAETLQD